MCPEPSWRKTFSLEVCLIYSHEEGTLHLLLFLLLGWQACCYNFHVIPLGRNLWLRDCKYLLWNPTGRSWMSVPSLTSYEDNNSPYLTWRWGDIVHVKCLVQYLAHSKCLLKVTVFNGIGAFKANQSFPGGHTLTQQMNSEFLQCVWGVSCFREQCKERLFFFF